MLDSSVSPSYSLASSYEYLPAEMSKSSFSAEHIERLTKNEQSEARAIFLSFFSDLKNNVSSSSMQELVDYIDVALSKMQEKNAVGQVERYKGLDWFIMIKPRRGDDVSPAFFDLERTLREQTSSSKVVDGIIEKIQIIIANDRVKRNAFFSNSVNMARNLPNEIKNKATSGASNDSVSGGGWTTSTSYSDMWAEFHSLIGRVKSNHVDFYANLLQAYTQMFDAYNSFVQKAAADAVFTQDDANKIWFEGARIERQGYMNFKDWVEKKYISSRDVFKIPNFESLSPSVKQDIEAILKPAFVVSKDNITFDLTLFDSIRKQALTNYNTLVDWKPGGTEPEKSDGKQITVVAYQAWLASFNSVGSGLQSNMQTFAQKYTQANSTFDNLNKILSGFISALGESAKEVMKSI